MHRGRTLRLFLMLSVFGLILAACGEQPAEEVVSEPGPPEDEEDISTPTDEEESPVTQDEAYTLQAVTFIPETVGRTRFWIENFIDEINDRSNGELTVAYLGGPEAISSFDQGLAVSDGVVDIAYVPASFYSGLVPTLGDVGRDTRTVDPEVERELLALFHDLHREANLFYLGRTDKGGTEPKFYIFTQEPMEDLSDLEGLRLQTGFILVHALPELGATPVAIEDEELYGAMQAGIVDGFINPIDEITPLGLHEVITHMLDEPFLTGNVSTIMNLDSWNSLPSHLQDLVLEVQAEIEDKMVQYQVDAEAEARQELEEAGVTFTRLPSEQAEQFHQTINEVELEGALEEADPDLAEAIRRVFERR